MNNKYLEGLNEQAPSELAEQKSELKKPKRYKVILLNDDYTPMEFVVHVLMKYFYMNKDKATVIMLDIHYKGRAICGIFTREIAETKMQQVNQYSAINDHPLLCDIEPE